MKLPTTSQALCIACALLYTSSAWVASAQASPGYITIDAPGANQQYNSGTWAMAVNRSGEIAGQFTAADQDHWTGFLRNTDGSYVEFDPPNAWDMSAAALNNSGEIAGTFSTEYNWRDSHGFLRTVDGTITTFDVPGSTNSTTVADMNEKGTIVGWSFASGAETGFIRTRDGKFASIAPPGSVSTEAYGINDSGQVAGSFLDANRVGHGFIRGVDGTLVEFDLPRQYWGPTLRCLDAAGNYYGWYIDAGFTHAFTRKADGSFASLDPPGSATATLFSTSSQGIVVGEYMPQEFTGNIGFVYKPNGTFQKLHSSPLSAGLSPTAASPRGKYIVGYYGDASGIYHGFTRVR